MSPFRVHAADVDESGYADLLVVSFVSDHVTLLLNRTSLPVDVPITQSDLPLTPFLSQNYPNPFNPQTTIEFSLPRRTHVDISIYNVLGQRVRHLLGGMRSAGRHSIWWNGQDDAGNRCATGVYFYRLNTESYQESRKLLLVR
jgi:hypothetical protein